MATSKKAGKTGEKERAAATGRPTSPTEDLTDHSVSASEIARQVDPKGESGATVNAKSMEKVGEKADADEEKAKAIEDNSLAGRIRRSGLLFVRNHVTGEDYVGVSPQNDPNATAAEKRLSAVAALDGVAPRTGMIVKPAKGDAFTVGEGFGPDKTPADWAAVNSPDGKPLFG
jgi:hypothetical protein